MLRKFYGFLIMNKKIKYKENSFKKYISNSELTSKIKEIADFINEDYLNNSIFIGVLDGSVRFMMDLLNNFKILNIKNIYYYILKLQYFIRSIYRDDQLW